MPISREERNKRIQEHKAFLAQLMRWKSSDVLLTQIATNEVDFAEENFGLPPGQEAAQLARGLMTKEAKPTTR